MTNNQSNNFRHIMVFLRVGWMHRYCGQSTNDTISGGSGFISEKGFGHEIYNFKPYAEKMYGYAQPSRGGHNTADGANFNIDRLGASPDDDLISNVLAVWCAPAPKGKIYIVGWYRNATIHRKWQPSPPGSDRHYADTNLGYYVSAIAADCTLLDDDERVFQIPHGKGRMGQSHIWYADDPKIHTAFRKQALEYINTGNPPKQKQKNGTRRQSDPFLRQKIEKAAVKKVWQHYERLGYKLKSVEKDNVGWDIEAEFDYRKLKIEVKGLTGDRIVVELTPNEFKKMKEYRSDYRVCIVSSALSISPNLSIFSYSLEGGRWENRSGVQFLEINERISATCIAQKSR